MYSPQVKIKSLSGSSKKNTKDQVVTVEVQVKTRQNRSAASPAFVGILANLNTKDWFPVDWYIVQFSIRKQQSVVSASVKHNKVVTWLPP